MTDQTEEIAVEEELPEVAEDTRSSIEKAIEKIEPELANSEPEVKEEEPKEPEYTGRFEGYDKAAKEELAKLPPSLQKIIDSREEKYHRGLDQYRDTAETGKAVKRILAQDIDYLRQYNGTPEQYIGNMVSIERQLRTGDDRTKVQVLQGLAHDYGIDFRAVSQLPFDPYAHQLAQENRALKQREQFIQASTQSAEEEQLTQLVEGLLPSLEYIEELYPTIEQILSRGMAEGNTPEEKLKDAHAKALRLNDGVFQKHQAAQLENQRRQQAIQANQAAKAAKAAAVSVKGAPSGKSKPPEPANTVDAVRQAFAAHGL